MKSVKLSIVTTWSSKEDIMSTLLFDEINSEKKNKIINASIVEFAQFGFTNSSTNRIVKEAGISKGSLFQYFKNKEELYFYILDSVVGELLSDLKEQSTTLSHDFFERVIDYAMLEFTWYLENHDKYKMIVWAFTKNDTDLFRKVEVKYRSTSESIFHNLIEDTNIEGLGLDQKTIHLIKWVLKGFNDEFIYKAENQGPYDLALLKYEYSEVLTKYLEILKIGISAYTRSKP